MAGREHFEGVFASMASLTAFMYRVCSIEIRTKIRFGENE